MSWRAAQETYGWPWGFKSAFKMEHFKSLIIGWPIQVDFPQEKAYGTDVGKQFPSQIHTSRTVSEILCKVGRVFCSQVAL